jgi:hypothetical protein
MQRDDVASKRKTRYAIQWYRILVDQKRTTQW